MMLNEIAILSHPQVREHAHIIELEGVCWDIESESQVWPVLIFDKTHWGDLSDFINRPEWQTLSAPSKMSLCSDIGQALFFMHDKGIIHGDLKPENVLIYKDGMGLFVARLTDFGYSTRFTHDHENIQMPRSWPWYAPEHHHRGFKPEQAKVMDMFSFGVLSLWIMYKPYLSGEIPLPSDLSWASEYIRDQAECADRQSIEKLKKDDKLSRFSKDILRADADLEGSAKLQLEGFFGVTLICDPALREAELYLQGSLSPEQKGSISRQRVEISDFQLSKSLDTLYYSDYRIRRCIREALEKRAALTIQNLNEEGKGELNPNLLFQLAVCYKIGFGGPADAQRTALLLHDSVKSEHDLTEVLKELKSRESNSSAIPGVMYATLDNMGLITYQDVVSQYHACGILEEAEHEIRREVDDLQASLGRRNGLWTSSATVLAGIYSITGRMKYAETWYIEVMNILIEEFGDGHENATVAAENVGAALFTNGAFSEAARIQSELLEAKRDKLLQKRVQNLMTVGAQGGIIYEMDDVSIETDDAIRIFPEANLKLTELSDRITRALLNMETELVDALQYETWRLMQEIAGPDHQNTLSTMHGLTEKFSRRREWDQVERLQREDIDIMEKKFGADHPRTLGRMSNLSDTFARQGKWHEAQKLQEACLATCVRCLSPQHRVTKVVMTNLMNTYQELGLGDESAKIKRQLEDHYRKELGNHLVDRGISDSMASLALTYRTQGRLREAEVLQRQVLEEREGRLGKEHLDTKQTISEISSIQEQLMLILETEK